jgi:hypothetical protein
LRVVILPMETLLTAAIVLHESPCLMKYSMGGRGVRDGMGEGDGLAVGVRVMVGVKEAVGVIVGFTTWPVLLRTP